MFAHLNFDVASISFVKFQTPTAVNQNSVIFIGYLTTAVGKHSYDQLVIFVRGKVEVHFLDFCKPVKRECEIVLEIVV